MAVSVGVHCFLITPKLLGIIIFQRCFPKYKRVVNIHGYYRIRQYCLQPGDYETDNEAELIEESFGSDNENEF